MQPQGLALLPAGSLFHGRYVVIRGLGAGAMGAVHEVRDQNTNHRCALKVMLPMVFENAELRARFAQEARVTGDIVSDHLVRVLDSGVDAMTGMPFLVMELLRGEELGRLVKQRGRLTPGETGLYLSQAALALDKTHAAGIVHRDLKPGNLFITHRDDGSACLKILDFGIAKVVASGPNAQTTKAMGTPLYMAPEQILGKGGIGPATDIYALGHIAYALLVGETYWAEESRALDIFPFMQAVIEGAPELPTERALRRMGVVLPTAFDDWFRKATARVPAQRFERATVAVTALRSVLAEENAAKPVPAYVPAPIEVPKPAAPPSVGQTIPTGAELDGTKTAPMSRPPVVSSASAPARSVMSSESDPATVPPVGSTAFGAQQTRFKRPFVIGVVGFVSLAGAAAFLLRNAGEPSATSSFVPMPISSPSTIPADRPGNASATPAANPPLGETGQSAPLSQPSARPVVEPASDHAPKPTVQTPAPTASARSNSAASVSTVKPPSPPPPPPPPPPTTTTTTKKPAVPTSID